MLSYFYQDTTNGTLQHKTTYTYDTLNRLGSSIATPVAPGTAAHNLDFSYDRFGNMTCVMDAQTNGPCPSWTFNSATNRINNANFTYDAAGNLTQDGTGVGTHTYQWDAENRLKSVDSGSTASFTYNALGQRVRKQIPGYDTHYVWDASGQELGSYNGIGNYWWTRNLVLGGRSFAIYFSNYVRFLHANHLGTTTVVTDQTGAELQDQLFYPWGQQWTYTGTQQDLHFASLQQIDPDLGLYPTVFRMYSPTQGRWLTGDPDHCGVENPQGFNRYAYVVDNPTNKIDPLGNQFCDPFFDPWCGWCDPFFGCGFGYSFRLPRVEISFRELRAIRRYRLSGYSLWPPYTGGTCIYTACDQRPREDLQSACNSVKVPVSWLILHEHRVTCPFGLIVNALAHELTVTVDIPWIGVRTGVFRFCTLGEGRFVDTEPCYFRF